MLTITEPAANHLGKLLDEAEAPEGTAARCVASEEGLSLQIDSPGENDHTFEHDGKTLLVLDPQVAELLSDKTLAFEQTDDGPALAIQGSEEEGEADAEA
ncbi:MAG: hypothetical protein ACOC9P_01235 [bacterium]